MMQGDAPVRQPLDFIDLSLWQEFQEGLARSLAISVALYDTNGSLLAPVTNESRLCEMIKGSRKGVELCKDFCMKAVRRAIHRGEPYIFECHTHQYTFTVPITFDKDLQLVILGGHTYLSNDEIKRFMEKAAEYQIDEVAISNLIKELKPLSPREFYVMPERIRALATPMLRGIYSKGLFQKGLHQMKGVFSVTSSISQTISEEDVYKLIFNALTVLFDVDTACIMIRDINPVFKVQSAFGRWKDTLSTFALSDTQEMVKRVIGSRRFEGCSELSELRRMGLPDGITSIHLFPIAREQEVYSLLGVFNTILREEEIKLVSALCRQLSIITENMYLKGDVERRLKALSVLNSIYKAIASTLDLETLYETILNKSIELVGAEQGSLMILDKEAMELAVKATKGIDKAVLEDLRVRIGEGISGKVLERGTPLLVKDIERDIYKEEDPTRKNRPRYKTGSFVSIPLKVNTRTIGVLNISDKITGEVFSEEDRDVLLSFAHYASVALERGEYYREAKELKEVSITDPLTGLLNRRYFQERVFEEAERSKRHRQAFTLFMIDIDGFKNFNDSYGHIAGDQALRTVANALREGVRAIDVVARYGGEEFSVILPYTNKGDSIIIAERIRKGVEDTRFWGEKVPPGEKLTISLGIATYPDDSDSIEGIVERADRALYLAKARGKNMVVGYEG